MSQMHSEHFPDSFYRVSVKGLFAKEGKVLLSKEADSLSGKWELPGGGLDFGEYPKTGLMREIEEEMGLKVVSVSDYPIYTWTARFDGWRNMDWYYSLVLAYRIELEDLDFTPSEECLEVGLFDTDELKSLDIYLQSAPLREHFKVADFD